MDNNYGFVKVAAASPIIKVADCNYNTEQIYKLMVEADKKEVSIVVFPELSITGYTCGDLFNQRLLIDKAKESLVELCEKTKSLSIVAIVGLPLLIEAKLYNVAAVICKGRISGIVPKVYLPNYSEFYEKRWFNSASELNLDQISLMEVGYAESIRVSDRIIFKMHDVNFAIEICEDLWTAIPPSSFHSLNGADIIFNLSASNESIGKHTYRKNLVRQQSARCFAGYVYSSASSGESTTDLVYSGCNLIAEDGALLAEGERYTFENQLLIADIDVDRLRQERMKNKSFTLSPYKGMQLPDYLSVSVDDAWNKKKEEKDFELSRYISKTPFIPNSPLALNDTCEEVFAIQSCGLAKRLKHIGAKDSVIGISGGLDSTQALLVLVNTYDQLGIDRKHIWGITMPGFGTSNRTYENALKLMKSLGISVKEISIADAVTQHLKDINHDINNQDVTYENAQARERTQILMDYANKVNGLVIGTGDLSELALGWCTYNGDHMSMYAVNASVPKTLMRALVTWFADNRAQGDVGAVLHDIVDTPVSPELLPADEKGEIAQKTEDVVGPYLLHDFFLFYVLRHGFLPSKVFYLAQHAFKSEYSKEEIIKWLKVFYPRFFTQQFKRSCMPDGPRVGSVSLSPRGDWKMPSDASFTLWMNDLGNL